MRKLNVVFCYFDRSKDTITEVLGHIDYSRQKDFINELYYMKLDANYSTKKFFKPGFSTGDLVSSFYPEMGILDFTPVFGMINTYDSKDERLKRVVHSFLEKLEVDNIREFSVEFYNEIIRNSFNSSFLQPDTYQFNTNQSKSISANTKAIDMLGYDFGSKEQQQTVDFEQPKMLFKVS